MTQQTAEEQDAVIFQTPKNCLEAVRRWPDDVARAWTLSAIDQGMTDVNLVALVATGSSVRDVEYSDDLDLVFVYQNCRPAIPRPPISIDLRGYDEAEVFQKLADGHDYLSWTVRFGQVLFERDGWWTKLRSGWNNRLSLPSATDARDRAENAECLSMELREAGDEDAADELQLSSLTHLCRAELSCAHVFPKSRPELVGQLREIGQHTLADQLADALDQRIKNHCSGS